MPIARVLCFFVVVALLAPPAGGALDLCACAGQDHGLFCDSVEPAPQPTASQRSCCAQRAEQPSRAHADEVEGEGEGCPDCPSLDLGSDLVLDLPAQEASLEVDAVWLCQAPRPRVAVAPSAGLTCFGGWPQPPPPKLRLHLLYQVLLS